MSAAATTDEQAVGTPAGHERAVGDTFDLGGLLTRGAVAGLAGGVLFILADMWFTTTHGKPAGAPAARPACDRG